MSDSMNELRGQSRAQDENTPRGLKALAPEDFKEEMEAITGGVKRAAAKLTGRAEPVPEGEPVPVDVAAKKSFLSSAVSVAGFLFSAAGDAFKSSGTPGVVKKKEPRRPIFAEEHEEDLPEPPRPSEKKIAKAAHRAGESIKSGVAKVLSEEHREAGRAVAQTFGGGFGEAFRGVAQGAQAIRQAIVKKVPQSAPVFEAVGKVTGKAGELAGDAARATGRGIKAAGSVASEKLRDLKDSGVFQNAGARIKESASGTLHSLAEGTKRAGSKIGEATRNAAEGVKKGTQNAGTKFSELKEKAGEKLAERRAASAEPSEHTPSALGEKLRGLTEKTKERFESAKNAATEKAHTLAEGARSKLEQLRSEHEPAAGEHEHAHAEKLKDIAGNFQAKAKGFVGKAREKMEHFITDEDETHDRK